LGSCQCRELVRLLHNASLPLGKGGVPPQLVVDELHFDLHPSFRLLAVVGGGGAIGFASPSTRWVRPIMVLVLVVVR